MLVSRVAAGSTDNVRGDSTSPGNQEHLSHSLPLLAHSREQVAPSSVATTFMQGHGKHRKKIRVPFRLEETESPFALLHICSVHWQVGRT